MKLTRLKMDLTAVEADDLRRLANRLADHSGKLDPVRTRVLIKLQRAATDAEARAAKRGAGRAVRT